VATDAYNITVEKIAESKGLAFVDTKAAMEKLSNGGIVGNGYTVTSTRYWWYVFT
jgi:hypothetical protein